MRGHAAMYRRTGGRIGGNLPGLPSLLLLDHVGARSGRRRTTPLVYTADGDNLVIVASKGGHPRNPAWYHNLMAHPDVEIQVGRRAIPVHARVAQGDEREQLWKRADEINKGGYSRYQAKTERQIPVVVLERQSARSGS